jgi:hypothetical protein
MHMHMCRHICICERRDGANQCHRRQAQLHTASSTTSRARWRAAWSPAGMNALTQQPTDRLGGGSAVPAATASAAAAAAAAAPPPPPPPPPPPTTVDRPTDRAWMDGWMDGPPPPPAALGTSPKQPPSQKGGGPPRPQQRGAQTAWHISRFFRTSSASLRCLVDDTLSPSITPLSPSRGQASRPAARSRLV